MINLIVPIIFTITPCGSAKTLEFMKWLGIRYTNLILQERLKNSEDILEESVKLSRDIFEILILLWQGKRHTYRVQCRECCHKKSRDRCFYRASYMIYKK